MIRPVTSPWGRDRSPKPGLSHRPSQRCTTLPGRQTPSRGRRPRPAPEGLTVPEHFSGRRGDGLTVLVTRSAARRNEPSCHDHEDEAANHGHLPNLARLGATRRRCDEERLDLPSEPLPYEARP